MIEWIKLFVRERREQKGYFAKLEAWHRANGKTEEEVQEIMELVRERRSFTIKKWLKIARFYW